MPVRRDERRVGMSNSPLGIPNPGMSALGVDRLRRRWKARVRECADSDSDHVSLAPRLPVNGRATYGAKMKHDRRPAVGRPFIFRAVAFNCYRGSGEECGKSVAASSPPLAVQTMTKRHQAGFTTARHTKFPARTSRNPRHGFLRICSAGSTAHQRTRRRTGRTPSPGSSNKSYDELDGQVKSIARPSQ